MSGGGVTSIVEVTNVSVHGIWLYLRVENCYYWKWTSAYWTQTKGDAGAIGGSLPCCGFPVTHLPHSVCVAMERFGDSPKPQVSVRDRTGRASGSKPPGLGCEDRSARQPPSARAEKAAAAGYHTAFL